MYGHSAVAVYKSLTAAEGAMAVLKHSGVTLTTPMISKSTGLNATGRLVGGRWRDFGVRERLPERGGGVSGSRVG